MKKLNVKNNVFLIAQESWKGCRKLDYYLVLKNGKKYYAFSRDYSRRCHTLCQGATPVNTILKIREHNKAVMNLKKYLGRMMPFLMEYYGISA